MLLWYPVENTTYKTLNFQVLPDMLWINIEFAMKVVKDHPCCFIIGIERMIFYF